MKRNVRIFAMILALLLCMSTLLSCAASAPQDGEIGTNKAPGSGFLDGVFGGGAKDEAMSPDAAPPMEAPGSDDGYDIEGGFVYGDGTVGGTNGSGFEQQAGQLTGAEWNDNDHFDAFVEKINGQGNGWYEIAAKWNQIATKRIHVRLHNGQDKAVPLAVISLLNAEGDVLWTAVTDADGDAYLFYHVSPTITSSMESLIPASIQVSAPDGKRMTHQLQGNETEVVLALDTTADVTKLDVMFMIDTTGSMGDELEYLKAEMGDVIRRVARESNVSVRTSVNFYRDKGDEYELRYFDFRSDVDEAVSILAKQRAAGGGDYEEAVDTALDYAINQARWDEDAVKLVFLVLDAPPHYTADTVRTINAAITKAAEEGIRIIPIASSGVDMTCQVLFRTWAVMTGGTYTYLTNHSGIGGSHDKPDVEEETVELLNNMLVRIIKEYVEGKPEENAPEIEEEIKSPTYTDSFGDTFTYQYLSSTTVEITGFSGSAEPHLVTIPAYVIEGDVKLKVVGVGDSLFLACSNVSAVKCDAELEKIKPYTFAYCEALITVELPDSLKSIGNGAFYHCSALKNVDLGESVQDIGKNAFSYCAALSDITFPASLRHIDEGAFAECTALTAVELPEGVVSVGAQAFYNCTSVEKLTLPASLTDIGAWAFNSFIRTLPDEAITAPEGSVAAEYVQKYRS